MKTYWNGLETEAVRGSAVVAPTRRFANFWGKELAGRRIDVVRVNLDGVNAGGGIAYLDDRDGEGWMKVTVGMGSPRYEHRNVNIEEGSFVEYTEEDEKKWSDT